MSATSIAPATDPVARPTTAHIASHPPSLVGHEKMETQTKTSSVSDGSASPLSSVPSDGSSEEDWEDVDSATAVDEEEASDTSDTEVDVKSEDVQDKNKPFKEKIAQATAQAKALISPSKKRSADASTLATDPIAPKRPSKRDRNAEAALEVQKLPYQSIISLNMPPRLGLRPGHPPPEPVEGEYPFGDTEDHNNSYIIHLMDEQELTYTKAADVYSAQFPYDVITDEAVRKRHIRCLLRLKKRFGLKPEDQIGPVSKNVKRRGTPRARKWSTVQPATSHNTALAPPVKRAAASDSESEKASKKRKMPDRKFEKTCIVVWHDAHKMDFRQIRDKLETEMGWSLGLQTIEKYYYLTLDRVYGKGVRKERKDIGEEGKAENWGVGFEERVVERRMSF
jgi:hypothetical protein